MPKFYLPVVHTETLAFENPLQKPATPLDGHHASHDSRWDYSSTFLHRELVHSHLIRNHRQIGRRCTLQPTYIFKRITVSSLLERQVVPIQSPVIEILAFNQTSSSFVASVSSDAERIATEDVSEHPKVEADV